MSKKKLTFRERVIITKSIQEFYKEYHNTKSDFIALNNLLDKVMNFKEYKYLNDFEFVSLELFNIFLNIYVKKITFIDDILNEKYLIKNLLLEINSCIKNKI